jgi:putative FmdB family regulatory protein
MPIYCYQCEACGAVQEEFHFQSRAPEGLACAKCGGAARRCYAAESPGSRVAGCGEIRSVAAGVMPAQAAGAQKALAARGVEGVRFDPSTGDAIFADRPSRLRALRVMGLHDKDEIRG